MQRYKLYRIYIYGIYILLQILGLDINIDRYRYRCGDIYKDKDRLEINIDCTDIYALHIDIVRYLLYIDGSDTNIDIEIIIYRQL